MQAPVIHILIDDDGIPRTINRRVKVRMIAQQHLQGGMTIYNIADHYRITLADVYAALAYYHDNREFFDKKDQELQPLIDDAQQYTANLKAKIIKRLGNKDTS